MMLALSTGDTQAGRTGVCVSMLETTALTAGMSLKSGSKIFLFCNVRKQNAELP